MLDGGMQAAYPESSAAEFLECSGFAVIIIIVVHCKNSLSVRLSVRLRYASGLADNNLSDAVAL